MSRPFLLDPLFQSVSVIPGIGPRLLKMFERMLGGTKIWDLLCHLPIDVIDRRHIVSVRDTKPGTTATVSVTVLRHTPAERKGQPYRITCFDHTGTMNLVYFRASHDWLKKQYPIDKTIFVSGKIDKYNEQIQIVHPDMVAGEHEKEDIAILEPVYPLTAGLTNRIVRKAVSGSLKNIPALPEWLDASMIKQKNWPAWNKSLHVMHFNFPGNEDIHGKAASFEPDFPARQRLAYDELLSNQLALALVRNKQMQKKGRQFKATNIIKQRILDALPFDLTESQKAVLQEISNDMNSENRMMRLLQGDVGSGKTVVAALAIAQVLENGAQAAFMAPTEILARQHAETLEPLLQGAGITCVTLTGRNKGKQREFLLQKIRDGEAQVVIGTHALFQKDVVFYDLGLAIIDEQHRFGVHQRMELSGKSDKAKGAADVLVMTATPIPRTLTLTAYGDMECSRITEKPPGRKPVDTRLVSKERMEEMIKGIGRRIRDGEQVYWICPLVEDSDVLDLTSAEERFQVLQSFFGSKTGLIHGRMKPDEKDAIIQQFADGAIAILVSTTVIEVGINVPNATVMVIEHAERFGLAQLHQLRGRVGRGRGQSYCFLVYTPLLSQNAKERLDIMRKTEDGFLISEKDLKLRGGGEVLGIRQSGLPEFRFASLESHDDLLHTARNDARFILEKDPGLKGKRGEALRHLLYLFERDQAIRYLQSG